MARTCPDCKGSGSRFSYRMVNGHSLPYRHDCSRCRGAGSRNRLFNVFRWVGTPERGYWRPHYTSEMYGYWDSPKKAQRYLEPAREREDHQQQFRDDNASWRWCVMTMDPDW